MTGFAQGELTATVAEDRADPPIPTLAPIDNSLHGKAYRVYALTAEGPIMPSIGGTPLVPGMSEDMPDLENFSMSKVERLI